MLRILATTIAALVGLAFGSFLNVCLSRWPEGESVVRPRSHCRSCGRTLKWWENVPLVSWLTLRGRCRTCRARIGWRYPLVELSVAGIWAYLVWRLTDSFIATPLVVESGAVAHTIHPLGATFGLLFLSWILIGLAVLDAEHLWLADLVTVPVTLLGILDYSFTFIGWGHWSAPAPWIHVGLRVLGCLAAALLILLIRWTYKLIRKREGIGLGDAKLMAMLAAWLGLQGALLAFAIGVVFGSLVALIVLALPATPADNEEWAAKKLPLGTFLCIGGVVSALWGLPIIAAYLRWAGL